MHEEERDEGPLPFDLPAAEPTPESLPPEPEELSPPAPGDYEALRQELAGARERVTQLERERSLLSQGVPEEDLDYYVFKIGKLTHDGKDFDAAAKEFLAARRNARPAPLRRSTGASLAGRALPGPSASETMNRLLRGQ